MAMRPCRRKCCRDLLRASKDVLELFELFGPEIDGWLILEQTALENLRRALDRIDGNDPIQE